MTTSTSTWALPASTPSPRASPAAPAGGTPAVFSDWVEVYLDPAHGHRTAFVFALYRGWSTEGWRLLRRPELRERLGRGVARGHWDVGRRLDGRVRHPLHAAALPPGAGADLGLRGPARGGAQARGVRVRHQPARKRRQRFPARPRDRGGGRPHVTRAGPGTVPGGARPGLRGRTRAGEAGRGRAHAGLRRGAGPPVGTDKRAHPQRHSEPELRRAGIRPTGAQPLTLRAALSRAPPLLHPGARALRAGRARGGGRAAPPLLPAPHRAGGPHPRRGQAVRDRGAGAGGWIAGRAGGRRLTAHFGEARRAAHLQPAPAAAPGRGDGSCPSAPRCPPTSSPARCGGRWAATRA